MPQNNPAWHAQALKMHAAGIGPSEISDKLKKSLNTVRSLLKRSKRDPEGAAQKVLESSQILPVELTQEAKDVVIASVVSVEERKSEVTLTSLKKIEDFFGQTDRQTEAYKVARDHAMVAIETLKAMRSSTVNIQQNTAVLNSQRITRITVEAVGGKNTESQGS